MMTLFEKMCAYHHYEIYQLPVHNRFRFSSLAVETVLSILPKLSMKPIHEYIIHEQY